MVHALKLIHGLLDRENGRLLDIHPNGKPAPIYVRLDDERQLTGWIQEGSDYEKYLLADQALAEVIRRGLFIRPERQLITFSSYATDLESLRRHLKQNWQDAWIEDLVALQIENQLRRLAKHKEILVEEQIWLSRLQPIFENENPLG